MGTVTAFGESTSFLLEVATGSKPGHTGIRLVMRNPSLGPGLEDITSAGGDEAKPSVAETLEAVSDSASDDVGGIGALQIELSSLDSDYIPQASSVILDGTSPVPFPNEHLRALSCFVKNSGSNNKNVGKITIRVSGGGATRLTIEPDLGISQDGKFTIPAARTGYLIQTVPFYPKGQSGTIRAVAAEFETQTEITGLICPFYQSNVTLLTTLPGSIKEKSDITFRGDSKNPNIDLIVLAEMLIIDDTIVPQSQDVFGFRGF